MADAGTLHSEQLGIETFTFDNNAKNFLGKKLVKEISNIAEALEEVESFMLDPTISAHEIAEFLAQEGKSERIRSCFERFTPVVMSQIKTFIHQAPCISLSSEACIRRFKNKLKESFKGVNFTDRPLLKMIAEEFEFLIELAVLEERPRDVMLINSRARNIAETKDFAKSIQAKFKVEGSYRVGYSHRATQIHEAIKGNALVTEGEIPLHIKDGQDAEFIESITISKSEKSKPFEFATLKITYKEGEETKTVLFTISLLNSQLDGWGSSTVNMRDIFIRAKAEGHFEYIRFKVFEAIEDALIKGTLKTKVSIAKDAEAEKAKLEAARQEVKVKVAAAAVETKPASTAKEPKAKKKPIEGAKQFANIKIDAAAKALLKCPGVTEISARKHGECRTLSKTVDDKVEVVNLTPSLSSKSDVNPHALKGGLDRFKIDYEDFLERI